MARISRLPVSNPFPTLEKPYEYKPFWTKIIGNIDTHTPKVKTILKTQGKKQIKALNKLA